MSVMVAFSVKDARQHERLRLRVLKLLKELKISVRKACQDASRGITPDQRKLDPSLVSRVLRKKNGYKAMRSLERLDRYLTGVESERIRAARML